MQKELKIVREALEFYSKIPGKDTAYEDWYDDEGKKASEAIAALDRLVQKTGENEQRIEVCSSGEHRQLVEAKQSVKIIRRLYHFIDDQSKISCIAAALEWLAQNNFEIIYYSRPVSNNPHYPNLEFIAQNKEGISEEKYREFKEWERFPLNEISAYEKAKLKGE